MTQRNLAPRQVDAAGLPDGKILTTLDEEWVPGDAPEGGGGGFANNRRDDLVAAGEEVRILITDVPSALKIWRNGLLLATTEYVYDSGNSWITPTVSPSAGDVWTVEYWSDSAPGPSTWQTLALTDEFNDSLVSSKWSWLNEQPGVTSVAESGTTTTLTQVGNAAAGIYARTQPAPSGDFDVKIKQDLTATTWTIYSGILLYNEANGHSYIWGHGWVDSSGMFGVRVKHTSLTAYVSRDLVAQKDYYRVEKVGTTLNWYDSPDGSTWTLRYTEDISAHMDAISHIGFAGAGDNSNTKIQTLDYFRVT